MKLMLLRKWKKSEYTIGQLFVDDVFFCNTLEDKVIDLNKENKVVGKTAIPAGIYDITMNVISPKYSKRSAFSWCKGRLPRLLNVPHFGGVLIHSGNSANDTDGCILVGENKVKGGLVNSMLTLKKLWNMLESARKKGEKIQIEIINS